MIPSGRHTDWPWPFSYIPRHWLAWNSTKPPKQLIGNVPRGAHLDITPPWTFALCWPLYFTVRLGRWHFRTGFRYDYSDAYYTFVILTLKRLD